MELNYFDLVASIIILLLGLKGIINGLFKEVFGLIGIVGGIFIASRIGNDVGQILSDVIFKFDNSSAVNFTGFLTTLALFWLVMIVAGQLFKKLSSLSGLGAIDRVLGFVFGASKFFLIASVIAHAGYNIKIVKSTIDDNMSSSFLFPIFVQTGSYIMKLDPVEFSDEIDKASKTIESKSQEIVGEVVKESTKEIIQEVKKEVKKSMPKETKDINDYFKGVE